MGNMRKIIALLLLLCLILNSSVVNILALPFESEMQDGSTGATYDSTTGEADITTNTSNGGMGTATKEKWAIAKVQGTFTPTLYKVKYQDKTVDVGTYYDIDWTVGTTQYRNSKEDIEGFVREASKKLGISEEVIKAEGFSVHIYAQVNARKPSTSGYSIYTVKDNLDLLTSQNGNGTGGITWIAKVVRNIAKNLGVSNDGYAFYEVPGLESDEAQIILTFVKITGIKPDGSLVFEQIKDAEVIPAEIDETGRVLNIDTVMETEEGTAYLNDIITSPKNLGTTTTWDNDALPKNDTDSIKNTPQEVWRYNLGRITDLYNEMKKDISLDYYVNNQDKIDMIEGILRKGLSATKLEIKTMTTTIIEVVQDGPWTSTSKLYKVEEAILIDSLDEIILDTEQPIQQYAEGTIVYDYEYTRRKNQNNLSETLFETNKKSGNTTSSITAGKRSTAYLRYIVQPARKEIIIEETYKDNVLIDSKVSTKDLPLLEVSQGVYSTNVDMTDKRSEGYNFIEYKTSKELLNTMPTSALKQGTVFETIKNMDADENIYAKWRKDIISDTTESSDRVEEWRLSKQIDTLGYKNTAHMSLKLFQSRGHAPEKLNPSGSYKYKTINPNLQITKDDSPQNLKYRSWLHSKALTKGSYSVTLNNSSVSVEITGNANYIKSSDIAGYKAASWANAEGDKQGLEQYDIVSDAKGTVYAGTHDILKQETLKFGIENSNKYMHTYSVYHHITTSKGKDRCRCYSRTDEAKPSYDTANYNISILFDRHSTINTDSRMFKQPSAVEKVGNGKTTLSRQETRVLSIYPEIAMLFENNSGVESIKYVAGEQVRKIQPLTYHNLQYVADVKLNSVGMSIATTSQAKQTANAVGIGNKNVVHKGSGITVNTDITRTNNTQDRGQLIVKTYALDVVDTVKTAWGNAGYDTSAINNNFLASFGKIENGKWVFPAVGTEKLLVDELYTGPIKTNELKYTEKGRESRVYKLTVRGGVLVYVDSIAIGTVKTSNPALYEALEGMKLVGANKDATVLATFEHQTGKALTEQGFKDLAKVKKGIDNLEIGKGWYSEDSTALIIKEYTTIMELPKTGFTDKIPMTVKGLETPVSKTDYYKKMGRGYSIVRYSIKGSMISESFMEYNSKTGESFGKKEILFGVPNVSISDTGGLF